MKNSFLVMRAEGNVQRHYYSTFGIAYAEACRLANQKGHRFYVVKIEEVTEPVNYKPPQLTEETIIVQDAPQTQTRQEQKRLAEHEARRKPLTRKKP